MASPILVVNYCINDLSDEMIINNLKSLQRVIENSGANDEYHVFVLPVTSDSHIQVFYEKDFNTVKYEELKNIIEEKFKDLKKLNKKGSFIQKFKF